MIDYFEEYSKILRKKHGLPDDWHVYEAAHSEESVPKGFMMVRGCNFKKYVRGPKKGTPKIFGGKVDKATKRTFFMTPEELKEVEVDQ